MNDTHNTIESIRPIKKAAEKELLKRTGVTGVDIGYKMVGGKVTDELSIRIYVANKKDVSGKERIPKTVKGVKTDVIQLTFKPTAMVHLSEMEPRVDATRYDTLRGGMSIGPCRSIFMEPPDVDVAGNYIVVGTLGALVKDNGTGDPMLLTNFHVAAVNSTWSAGDDMAQPSLPDGGSCPPDRIGTLERAVIAGTTTGGGAGVDGAVISVAGRSTDCEVIGIGEIKGTAPAAENMAVRKRGRTTELTFGTVGSTDLTVTVPYGNGIGDVMFEDQIMINVDEAQSTTFGISGDSGSVIVNDDNRVVGLYFAGNNEERDAAGNVVVPEGTIGIANPIAAVEAALNVRICAHFKPIEKKIEIKEIEKHHIKDFIKELKEKDFKEFKEFGPKELKELRKEHKEPKEIYEDKRFEDKYFEGGGFPDFPGFPGGGGQHDALDDRLARIEAALGLDPMASPSAGVSFCEDFSTMNPQPYPNPWTYQGATITVFDHQGVRTAAAVITQMGSMVGLNAGFATNVKLPCACNGVDVVLTHFSTPATVDAFNAAAGLVDSASMAGASGSTETLSLSGNGIVALVIKAPQNEVLIHQICCQEPKSVNEKPWYAEHKAFKEKPEKHEVKEWKEKNEKFEKPEIKDVKEPKELKEAKKELKEPKELKEAKKELKEPKELKEAKKELKEPKELKEAKKELKEPKELKEAQKELKEPKEFKEIQEDKAFEKGFETGAGQFGADADMMQRIERIEAALAKTGMLGHFISPELRPDLAMGALRKEPDAQAISSDARQLQKQAADGKVTKDSKDAGEKPPEGYF